MKDWFESLQEEARAQRSTLRDDDEPLTRALARARQMGVAPPRRRRGGWYLPAASVAMSALSVLAVALFEFEGRLDRQASASEQAVSPSTLAQPTFVIGDGPSIHYASASYSAPLRVIDTTPQADRVAQQLKREDARLATSVPGIWRRVPLRAFAREIEARTGVRLHVSTELADRRVTVLAGKDASALQLMRGVAHLYGSGWFRSEPGPHYQYRLRRFDTPDTRGWLNALYQLPQRHAPGMDTPIALSAPTHLEWLEKLHQKTGRVVISDDTQLDRSATSTGSLPLFRALCNQAASAGQLWDSHADALTFRKASPMRDSLLPVPQE